MSFLLSNEECTRLYYILASPLVVRRYSAFFFNLFKSYQLPSSDISAHICWWYHYGQLITRCNLSITQGTQDWICIERSRWSSLFSWHWSEKEWWRHFVDTRKVHKWFAMPSQDEQLQTNEYAYVFYGKVVRLCKRSTWSTRCNSI